MIRILLLLAFALGSTAAAPPALIGQTTALREWRVAQNRVTCAPLALASNGGVKAKARRAYFGAGWGVGFDTRRVRSAYGFAGVGMLPDDALSHADKRTALAKQWPYTRELGRRGGLPQGSFAGYGLEGAARYPTSNPQGRGQHSLAYVRIPGQACMYNVWSRIGRRHLEQILDSLRLLPTPPQASLPPLPAVSYTSALIPSRDGVAATGPGMR